MLFNDYKPGHPNRKWFHKFQALFFLPVLSFYWLSSVFNPQILDLNQRGTAETMNWNNDYIKGRRFISVALRAAYIAMNVVAPFVHNEPGAALYHIWIMATVESIFLSGLFSLSHNFEGADRYPIDEFRETGETVCWFKAQVETSSTYGSFISGYITGGLNFQVSTR